MNTNNQTKKQPLSMLCTERRVRDFGMCNWLGLWTLYKREIHRFFKISFQTVISPIISSFLYLITFSVVLGQHGAFHAQGFSYVEFLVPGLVMMIILDNSFVNAAYSIVIAKVQGNIVDTLMPPLSPSEITLGLIAGSMTRGLIVGGCTYVLLSLTVAGFHMAHPFVFIFFAVCASCAYTCLGIISGLWSQKFDHLQVMVSFVITPLSFLSGTFYQIAVLPHMAQRLASFDPIFYFVDGFRYGALGIHESNILIGITLTACIDVILAMTCYYLLKVGYRIKS